METSLIRVCDGGGETHGTGFALSGSLAVTCAHVVEACGTGPRGRVLVVFHVNGERREAEVVADFWRAPDGDDIAVLRFERGIPPNVTPVRLGRTSGTDGHRCATLGYPRVGALQGVEGRGEIYRSVSEANGRRLIQLASKEITTGFSGAPLLDQVTGRVVGMITQIAKPDRYGRMGETAFATPAEVLHQLLRPFCPDLRLHPPQGVEDYLKAVAQFCRDLPYVSLKSDVPLETVYVRQQIRQELKEGQRASDEETVGEELAVPEMRSRPMTITQALEQHHCMVLVGGPGAGKSTLLRHLVQGLAEGTSDWHPHLPILVSLRGLAERENGLTTSLREQVQAELGIRLLSSLPKNFLTDWTDQTGVPWLIALDGVDEIVDDTRRRLLIRELKQAAWPIGSCVLITTRPDTSARLDGFTAFEPLPFEPDQVEEFAHNYFRPDETKARAFLASLQTARMGDVIRTPLLLTVAVTVFEQSPEASPLAGLRRSKLYGEFIRILLAEDAGPNRQMKAQFCQQFRTNPGERLFEYRREVLESVAMALQEERDVRDAVVKCLVQVVGWSAQDAARKADDVLEILARQRTGLVVLRGDHYEFIHPDFREYLSAAALVQRYGTDPNRVWGRVICRWRSKNWRGVALFALGVLSDGNKDVTPLLKVILRKGVSGLYFSGTALADRVRVADDLANRIIDALVARARQGTASDLFRRPNALEVLSRLGTYAPAVKGLLGLVRNKTVRGWVSLEAIEALGQLGRANDLLALARDETVDILLRRHAVQTLGRLRLVGEAIPILLTLAHDKTADSGMRMDVATVLLERWEQTDDAAAILLTLVRDERVEFGFRHWVAAWLKKLGRDEDLLTLARDESVDTLVRVVAAEELAELGRADDAVPILLAFARDERVDAWGHRWSVNVLRKLGRDEDLLTLARDESVDTLVRVVAAEELATSGDARLLPDLERIAQQDADEQVRRAAREAVEAFRQRLPGK